MSFLYFLLPLIQSNIDKSIERNQNQWAVLETGIRSLTLVTSVSGQSDWKVKHICWISSDRIDESQGASHDQDQPAPVERPWLNDLINNKTTKQTLIPQREETGAHRKNKLNLSIYAGKQLSSVVGNVAVLAEVQHSLSAFFFSSSLDNNNWIKDELLWPWKRWTSDISSSSKYCS